ncbi:hypothetical protein AB4Z17_32790, partial [Paenibacillus sp. TAF43_2]|uniref:hypothetical protein n=1 Tax=Paenibacillus sp. TAF43_2 TaxID=3233069 RepID=UPI003F9DF8D3
ISTPICNIPILFVKNRCTFTLIYSPYRFAHITIIRRSSLMLDMVSLSYYALQAASKGETELRGKIFAVGKTND